MSVQQAYICDGCGAVLHGRDRAAYIQDKNIQDKNYLQITGSFTLQCYDEDTGRRYYVHLMPRSEEKLNFCMKDGFPCVLEFVEQRKAVYAAQREQWLREEATKEHVERLELGGVNRAKPTPNTRSYSAPPAPAPSSYSA